MYIHCRSIFLVCSRRYQYLLGLLLLATIKCVNAVLVCQIDRSADLKSSLHVLNVLQMVTPGFEMSSISFFITALVGPHENDQKTSQK